MNRAYLEHLLSYSPSHVARARIGDASKRGSYAELSEASILIADFSGFTRLSEALEEMGEQGAQVLADLLNGYFKMFIDDIALRRDAALIKFGGDGFALFFSGTDGARQAAATGLEIQEAMALFSVAETPLGNFPLTLRVGIASGPVFEAVVGAGNIAEYLVGGETVECAALLQVACPAGQVRIGPATRERLGPHAQVEEDPQGLLLKSLAPLPPMGARHPRSTLLDDVDPALAARLLEPFVPPSVLPLIRARPEAPRLQPRYAPATALFIEVSGIPLGQGAKILPALVQMVESLGALVRPVGLPLRKTDVSPNGFKLIFVFGPPEGDATQVLNAAVTASVLRTGLSSGTGPSQTPQDSLQAFSRLSLRFGMATGKLWSGELGSSLRREYSAVGDVMNTAARLCDQAQPWEILCTESVAVTISSFFSTESAGYLTLKGKRNPVACHRVHAPLP